MMKCIIGLGNPGRKYEKTRHNIGFMVIDRLSSDLGIELSQNKFKCSYGAGYLNGEKVMLVKPQTFMNLSGEGVRPLLDYYKIDVEHILVLYDDLDLPVGGLRLRQKRSGGGQNGIKSLNQHLATDKYKRIRIGIDRPEPGGSITGYVLGIFPKAEAGMIDKVTASWAEASADFVSVAFEGVMTVYYGVVNGR